MWQTIDLAQWVTPTLIDNQTLKFTLSAWIGGGSTQNDHFEIMATFLDQSGQMLRNASTLGPVQATDRGKVSSLILQQTNGTIPVNARSVTLLAVATRYLAPRNNGAIDNISFQLYP